jgi:hypothetical protein
VLDARLQPSGMTKIKKAVYTQTLFKMICVRLMKELYYTSTHNTFLNLGGNDEEKI